MLTQVSKQAEAKRDGVINPQNYNFNQFDHGKFWWKLLNGLLVIHYEHDRQSIYNFARPWLYLPLPICINCRALAWEGVYVYKLAFFFWLSPRTYHFLFEKTTDNRLAVLLTKYRTIVDFRTENECHQTAPLKKLNDGLSAPKSHGREQYDPFIAPDSAVPIFDWI